MWAVCPHFYPPVRGTGVGQGVRGWGAAQADPGRRPKEADFNWRERLPTFKKRKALDPKKTPDEIETCLGFG